MWQAHPNIIRCSWQTSLRPIGKMFYPFVDTSDIIGFNSKRVSFTNFIVDHFDEATNEVSDEEHMAFLSLRLSHFIFCSSFLKVAKSFVTLANQLRGGRNVYLSQLILDTLYESLSLASHAMKSFSPTKNPKDTLLLAGPLWLL